MHGARSSADRSACGPRAERAPRSEEHTSELQSLAYLVCRLLLEKKKNVRVVGVERPETDVPGRVERLASLYDPRDRHALPRRHRPPSFDALVLDHVRAPRPPHPI